VRIWDKATGSVREEIKVLRHGLARRHLNKQIGRIKRMFAWAVEEELVPAPVHQALLCVKGLKKGKGGAREKPRIQRVPDAFVAARPKALEKFVGVFRGSPMNGAAAA
jgi:hypothetical protein